MKSLFIAILLCITTTCFANEERIKEIVLENTQIDQRIQQYQDELNRLQQIKLINLGRIEELKKIEADKQAEKTKEEKVE